ncbi:MAG TPA: maleylpyruvate isomerase N-terminal domain-containing protein [Actinomycetota bacterium]|nr:maleylpyruvate isomerase N-terminal domain-containing protein [Actinomycetota bacterium]
MADRDELLRDEDTAWRAFVAEVGRVPEHVRGNEGVVPGWSVNDLVYHVGKWAMVGGRKLELLRRGEQAQEDDDWEESNRTWAAESKSLSYEEAMAQAMRERERARGVLASFDTVDQEAASWFKEETTDHYLEHAQEVARFADSLGPGDAGHSPRSGAAEPYEGAGLGPTPEGRAEDEPGS